jgi:hypothetical protein
VNPIITLIEKAASTYVQVFITAWLAADTLGIGTAQAAGLAAIPAALTVIANGLGLTLRTLRTYAVSVIGFLVALPVFDLEISTLQAALLAGVPAALAVIKGGLASQVGDPESPALLPAGTG